MKQLYWSVSCVAILALLSGPPVALAQPVQPPSRAEAEAALNPAPPPLTPAQLDQLLAPIALYPDQLLTEVLMAATFPQQVIDAAKWLQDSNNAGLKGDQLVAALQPLPWDPSVKSLVAFPQILTMMSEHLDWTEALGAAFANQQVATMARVQFLRGRAVAAGRLKSSPQIRVQEEGGEVVIEPTDPSMIYVPVYNPAMAYGTWPDSDDPPVYIPPPPGFYNGEIGAAIGFSVGLGVVAPLWGWGHPNWRGHDVVVDPRRFNNLSSPNNNAGNHVAIQGNAWHRTGPIATVPAAQRPTPPASATEHPAGTVAPAAIKAPPARAATPGEAHPPAPATPFGAPATSGAPAHPGEPTPSTAAPAHPAVATPHPAEPPHPGEPSPAAVPPHPPGAAAPEHPAAVPHEAVPPHPPAAAPERPAAVPHEAVPPHPPAAAPERPAAVPHEAEPPHPPPPPHPAPAPPPAPHPAAPPPPAPHPPAAAPPHPPAPAKPPPKEGEEPKP